MFFVMAWGLLLKNKNQQENRTGREVPMNASMNSLENQLTYVEPPVAPKTGESPAASAAGSGFQPFGDDGFTFMDFLDIINPLQHLPVISNIYRNWSGDTIDPIPRIGGGALFGGPIGAIVSLVNVILDETTGKDIGDHVLAFLEGEEPAQNVAGEPVEIATAFGQDPDRPEQAAAASPIGTEIDVLYWARQEATLRQQAQHRNKPEMKVAAADLAGATAASGGWFSDVMLKSMEKYEQGANLMVPRPPPTVNSEY